MGDVISRRGFFKALAGGAVAVAALPAILEPARTIFLPPRQGWWQPELRMREVQQYLINIDSLVMRYDVAWDVHQYQVDFPQIPTSISVCQPDVYAAILEEQRRIARQTFEQIRRQHGFSNTQQRELPLPRGVDIARYV